MTKKHIARWAARILSILLTLFFLMFSFDEPILSLGFVMHNIPTMIIALTAFIAWKHEKIGGIIYLLLGIGTIFFFNVRSHPQALFLTLPFILIGILDIAISKQKAPTTENRQPTTDNRIIWLSPQPATNADANSRRSAPFC